MNKLTLVPEYKLYERNGKIFCDGCQVAENFDIDPFEKGLAINQTRVDALSLLETAIVLSYRYPDKLDRNLKLIDLAGDIFPRRYELPFLFHSATEVVMRNYLDSRPKERDIYKWFAENVGTLLGQKYKIVQYKNDPKHRPDFWLKDHSGNYTPVEVKLNSFDPRHLTQLLRYMEFYGCSEGLAVGKELNCELPNNVMFLKYNRKEVENG